MFHKKEFWAPIVVWMGLGIVGFLVTPVVLIVTAGRGVHVSPRAAFLWIAPATLELFLEAFCIAALIWKVKVQRRRIRILFGAIAGWFSPVVLLILFFLLKIATRTNTIEDLAWIVVYGFWSMSISGLIAGAYAAHTYARVSEVRTSGVRGARAGR